LNSQFINVGFGNLVNSDKIISIVSPEAAPIKRLVQRAKEQDKVVDATAGRKTKAVIVCENDRIVLSSLVPDTIGRRLTGVPALIGQGG
jgi:regulator of extracellular matrix RemA (YlzA/DUF370 family)